MSSWTRINGIIKLDGIKREGIIKAYGLDPNIEDYDYDRFVNNLKNFKYDVFKKYGLYIVKDHSKPVQQLLETLQTPTGSEGDTEFCLGNYPKHYKMWKCGNWSSSREYDKKHKRFVSEAYEEKIPERYLVDCWESSIGDNGIICLYGDLRDRTYDETEKEFIDYLKELDKYFNVFDVCININDSITNSQIALDFDIKTSIDYLIINKTETEYFEDNGKYKHKTKHNTKKIEFKDYDNNGGKNDDRGN